jgi:hypothetical protein
VYGTNREIDLRAKKSPDQFWAPINYSNVYIDAVSGPERRREYWQAYTAARRRARGVPELSSPDSITANKPWEAIGLCRRWWFERSAGKSRRAANGNIASGRMGEKF